MHIGSKLIPDFEVMESCESTSSVMMERDACKRVMNRLKDNYNVSRLCTDRSPSIAKLLRTEFPMVSHDFDPWHVQKSLKKRLVKASNKKNCDIIGKWTRSITNHLWFSADYCNGDPDLLVELWTSILYHISDRHMWSAESTHSRVQQCLHGEIANPRRKCWIPSNSVAFEELTGIVLNPLFLKDIRHIAAFIHTSALESFHNSLLKYVPKRLHFPKKQHIMRVKLAIIDNNLNAGLEPTHSYVTYRKSTKRWASSQRKSGRDNSWRLFVLAMILSRIKE